MLAHKETCTYFFFFVFLFLVFLFYSLELSVCVYGVNCSVDGICLFLFYFCFVDMPNEGGFFFFELYLVYWNGSKLPFLVGCRLSYFSFKFSLFFLRNFLFVDRMSLFFGSDYKKQRNFHH